MLTLGIESSCDETAIALVCGNTPIAEKIHSQAPLHALFGGVVPEVASREHYKALSYCLNELFTHTAYRLDDVDCIAVARGPGLLGSLLVGLAFAKGLSFSLQKPLLGINHLHAHITAIGLEHNITFPFIGILLSGGHTYTYYCSSYTELTILGKTCDDAVGEVLDKIGKMLGMKYPAGKCIEDFAKEAQAQALFTMPYCKTKTCDYSFSGLKTQVLHYLKKNQHCILQSHDTKPEENPACAVVCASLMQVITQTIVHKVEMALQYCEANKMPYTSLVLGGGVVANSFIREGVASLAKKYERDFFVPSQQFCTDNASMIAYLGGCLYSQGYYHTLQLSAIPRGTIVPQDYHKQ